MLMSKNVNNDVSKDSPISQSKEGFIRYPDTSKLVKKKKKLGSPLFFQPTSQSLDI